MEVANSWESILKLTRFFKVTVNKFVAKNFLRMTMFNMALRCKMEIFSDIKYG